MTVNYKDLGFVNTKEMFKKAYEGKYAIPAYNFNNMEQLQAIILACLESQSPVIIQVSAGARKYADADMLKGMAKGAMDMMKRIAKEKGLKEIPVALHLDHGANFDICKDCIVLTTLYACDILKSLFYNFKVDYYVFYSLLTGCCTGNLRFFINVCIAFRFNYSYLLFFYYQTSE